MSVRDDTISVSIKYQQRSLTVHSDETEGMRSKAAADENLPGLMVDNDWIWLSDRPYNRKWSVMSGSATPPYPYPSCAIPPHAASCCLDSHLLYLL